jgi:hypothetical protein
VIVAKCEWYAAIEKENHRMLKDEIAGELGEFENVWAFGCIRLMRGMDKG